MTMNETVHSVGHAITVCYPLATGRAMTWTSRLPTPTHHRPWPTFSI